MTKTHLIIALLAAIFITTTTASAERPTPKRHSYPSLVDVAPAKRNVAVPPTSLRYTGAGLAQTLFLKTSPVAELSGTSLTFQPGISRGGLGLEPAVNLELKNSGLGIRLQHIAQLTQQESRFSTPVGKSMELRIHHIWGGKSLLLTGVKVAPGTKLFYATNLATGQGQFRVHGQIRF